MIRRMNFVLVGVALITPSTFAAGLPSSLPNALCTLDRTSGVGTAEIDHEYSVEHILKPGYRPPNGALPVLLPRVNLDDCDMLRMSYQTVDGPLTITEVYSLVAIQNDLPADSTLTVAQVQERMSRLINSSAVSSYFNPSMGGSITPEGDGKHWWQQNRALCFILPSGPPDRFSVLNLGANARWFTMPTAEEGERGYWRRKNSSAIVRGQVSAWVADPEMQSLKQYSSWTIGHFREKYQPPKGLMFTSLPNDRTKGLNAAEMRYQVDSNVIKIAQTPELGIVEVDAADTKQGPLLSEERVEDLVRSIFSEADSAKVNATNESDGESEGNVTASGQGKVAWLNSVKWWEEPGRVIFYWNKSNPRK